MPDPQSRSQYVSDKVVAKYLIETALPVESVAEIIAGEQSSGTFLPIPGETEELKARSRATVTKIEIVDDVPTPSLRGAKLPSDTDKPVFRQAEITIEFPLANMGLNLPTLMATVCGNLYELAEHSGCKLLDLDLPEVFAHRYPGPKFGVTGTRRLADVFDRPIIGTIVKPSVGLSPRQTADLVRELGQAGIDFVKDDELMADPPHSPLRERVQLVMDEINRLSDETGRKVMYAVNISDEVDAMKRHHDLVLEHGGTCVMVSLNHVGLTGVTALRQHSQLPIHGHRNGWGMLTRHSLLGMEFAAYQKIWRTVGVDHLHVNGLQSKFWESDESVGRSIEALQQPLFGSYWAMPVVSSGQWGGQAPETFARAKTLDLMYIAGGGIMAHPDGPAAGLQGIQQAWEAAAAGIPLSKYAEDHLQLRRTLEKFGGLRR